MAKKILFINQEINPFVPETEMSVMGRELPHKAQEAGFEIRNFMPKWGTINERRNQLHEVIRLSGMNLIINESDHTLIIKVASIPTSRIQVYFIDNEDYFSKRQMEKNEAGVEYSDNGERAIFYIKTAYKDEPSFANSKVVMTLYEKQLTESLSDKFKKSLEFRDAKPNLLKNYKDKFDFLELGKLAIDYSDGVIEGGKEVNAELLGYAKGKNIPLLDYPGHDNTEAYTAFYESLIGEEK